MELTTIKVKRNKEIEDLLTEMLGSAMYVIYEYDHCIIIKANGSESYWYTCDEPNTTSYDIGVGEVKYIRELLVLGVPLTLDLIQSIGDVS